MQEHNTSNTRLERNFKFKFFQFLALKFRKDGLTSKEIISNIKKLTSLKKEEREKIEAIISSTKLPIAPPPNQDEIFTQFKTFLTKLQQASRMRDTLEIFAVIEKEIMEQDIDFLVEINYKLPRIRSNSSSRDLFEHLVDLDRPPLATRVCRELYDINWQDEQGNTVLHRAFPNIKNMHFILQIPGVDRDIKNKAGWSPLLLALHRAEDIGDFEPINLFTAKQKLKLDQSMNIQLITSAIRQNSTKLATLVLNNGFDANTNITVNEKMQRTPLWLACLKKSFAVANVLIKFDAKLNELEHLIVLAVADKEYDTAIYLLKKGVKPTRNFLDGTTLFLAGYDDDQLEFISTLLSSGYKFKIADFQRLLLKNDYRILDFMLSGEREEIISFYLCMLLTMMKHVYHPSLIPMYTPICDALHKKITTSSHLNTLMTRKAYTTITATLHELGIDVLENNLLLQQEKSVETADSIEIKHNLIREVLSKLSNIKTDIHQIVPDFQLPKFIIEINENILLSYRIERLIELHERISEWGQKTFYRLSRALENTNDTPTLATANTSTPTIKTVCSYLENQLSDIAHIYPIENSLHFVLLYDSELIKNLNSITEEEKTRFTNLLNQLRLCQVKGAQGIKPLKTTATCIGTINGLEFISEITHEIKLLSFKHRILVTSIYPDESSTNNTVLLFACFLRHGNEHDRPLNNIYHFGNIQLPLKPSLTPPAIDCTPEHFKP